MSRAWSEHFEAQEELRRAALWYDDRREGLGERFLDAVESAIESIFDQSIRWSFYQNRRRSPQIYSRSVAGFPFNIIYLQSNEAVFVVAYAHERRRPEYWRRRVTD